MGSMEKTMSASILTNLMSSEMGIMLFKMLTAVLHF